MIKKYIGRLYKNLVYKMFKVAWSCLANTQGVREPTVIFKDERLTVSAVFCFLAIFIDNQRNM